MIDVKLLSGALGAEISGIDLTDVSDENFKKINNLLLEHKVIFFRNQPLTSEQHVALASKFGPLETHAYVRGLSEFPEIIRIIKKPEEKTQWGEGWHSDVSYNEKPTKAVILKSIKIPPVGGDTVFSNMELAWETLEEEIKNKIKSKKAVHSSLGGGFFVNWTYTKEIVGMDKEESKEILNYLFEHQARLDLTCRFKWTENAIAIWDNRSVQHYAIADFYPNKGLGFERVMDRIAVEGDHPQ